MITFTYLPDNDKILIDVDGQITVLDYFVLQREYERMRDAHYTRNKMMYGTHCVNL